MIFDYHIRIGMNNVKIRLATPDDAAGILEVYAPYVTDTAISWEYEVPTLEEFRGRIEKTLKKYPYFVLTEKNKEQDKILGYAYAGPFVGRAAYDWSAELTIYLAPDTQKKGYGRMLYEAMEEALKKMGILNLYACIGYLDQDDEYVNKNSANFHEHLGYKLVARFDRCGYKFGRWYDMIWMEKLIGEHGEEVKPIICYKDCQVSQ